MSDPAADDAAPPRRRWSRWLFPAILAAWTLWTIGQLARDRNWLTGLCFYVPSPAIAAIAIAAGLATAAAKERRAAIALAVIALPPCAVVVFAENRWSRPHLDATSGGAIRLVHWNVAYGVWGRAEMERELVARKATAYVLSETPRTIDLEGLAARIGPGYDVVRVGGMSFIAEGRLRGGRRLINEGGLKVNAVTWEGSWGTVEIVGVDGPSDLSVPRDPVMQRVRSVLGERRPELTVGDFNAPRRSRALWPLPEGFAHAYERAGRGWSYTWPAVCPLYAIDQCIVSERVRPLRYELDASPYSDHLMQTLEFRLVAPQERAGRTTAPDPDRFRAGPAPP